MVNWQVRFQTFRPIPALPRPTTVASETRTRPSYRHVGRDRNDPHLLFQYTLSGCGAFRDASGVHEVHAGSGFLCKVTDPPIEYFYPDDATEPWTFLFCSFIGETASDMVHQIVERHGAIFRLGEQSEIIRRLSSYDVFDGVTHPISAGAGSKLVMDLLASLTESASTPIPKDSAGLLVRKAMRIIEENLSAPLSVAELADELYVSREHLTRIFTEQTGHPPYRYILRQKMLFACRLLKQTSMTNREITLRLGYDQPSQFTRAFKNVMGITPSRFRKTGVVPFA